MDPTALILIVVVLAAALAAVIVIALIVALRNRPRHDDPRNAQDAPAASRRRTRPP
jgi:hypothetical protein